MTLSCTCMVFTYNRIVSTWVAALDRSRRSVRVTTVRLLARSRSTTSTLLSVDSESLNTATLSAKTINRESTRRDVATLSALNRASALSPSLLSMNLSAAYRPPAVRNSNPSTHLTIPAPAPLANRSRSLI